MGRDDTASFVLRTPYLDHPVAVSLPFADPKRLPESTSRSIAAATLHSCDSTDFGGDR